MIIKAETTARLRIVEITKRGPLSRVTIEGRMGDAEPMFTRTLYVGDELTANLRIDVDSDDHRKWDKLSIQRDPT